jgi:predicted cupin superfamily sugar epimerase
MARTVAEWIAFLKLTPHPEGGLANFPQHRETIVRLTR